MTDHLSERFNSTSSEPTQDTVIVYGDISNRGGRVIWALEELGVPYETVKLQLFKGEQRSAEYLALNPKGKVPTLVIKREGGEPEIISESLAILYTLAERYPDRGLTIENSRQMAQLHEWMAFGATELEPPIWIHAKHTFVYPEKRRVADIFPSCHYDYQRALKHLESQLSDGRTWLVGAPFCAADIFIGQTLMWGQLRQLGELGEHVKAYLERLKARPAWVRTFGEAPA